MVSFWFERANLTQKFLERTFTTLKIVLQGSINHTRVELALAYQFKVLVPRKSGHP